MKSNRYLPTLIALSQQNKALRSNEVKELGKMNYFQFWKNCIAPKLEGHSTALFSSEVESTKKLLEHCPAISTGCLVISQQMTQMAAALIDLFPCGEVDCPMPGGVLFWHPNSRKNLRGILEQTQNLLTVVYMPGLQLSADVIEHLYTSHRNAGFLLISENPRQEMMHSSDLSVLFATDYLIIHGAGDTETISGYLPRTKVNQPQNNLVVNFHNSSMPMQGGKGMPLINRGNDCTKPHKLSLSLSQSHTLVEKPLLDGSELRQKRKKGATVVLNQADNEYYSVELQEHYMSLSDRLHAFFDRTAGV